ncbi:MAG: hypothetical protein NZZ41_04205 [Candidatus Dojkabacteria bacterium]|nr:hypothetical protein [Candidatus Dojkabacteria bacterium]
MRSTSKFKSFVLDNFRKGLNTFFKKNQVDDNELVVAKNIVYVGKGVPKVRPGTKNLTPTLTSNINLLANFVPATTNVQEILIIENGFLKKYTGTSWVNITGHTFSNVDANAVMYRNTSGQECLFIGNGVDPLTIYNGTTLTRYTQLNPPTGLTATVGSNLVGTGFTYSYRVTAVSEVGETQASANVVVTVNKARSDWNFDPNNPNINSSVLLTWNAVPGAIAYNVYGVTQNYETFLDRVTGATQYRDYGFKSPSQFFNFPTSNTTTAPRGSIMAVFKSSLFIVDHNVPYRLWYSAGVDKPESFAIGDGGGYIDVNSGGNDGKITALFPFKDNLIVFKENSIWLFDFTAEGFPVIKLLTSDKGCINKYALAKVENDIFFIGEKQNTLALYTLGYEPAFLNELRTNEISIRVKSELEGIDRNRYSNICLAYINGKVYIQLPEGNSLHNRKILVYDRERAAYSVFDNISAYRMNNFLFNNIQRILFINNSQTQKAVVELSDAYKNDNGFVINWVYETKFFDLSFPVDFKRLYWLVLSVLEGNGTIKLKVNLDDYTFERDLTINNQTTNTHFGYYSFSTTQFGNYNTTNTTTFFNFFKIPLQRLGQKSLIRNFSIRFESSSNESNCTIQNIEVYFKLYKNAYRLYKEIVQL